MKSNKQVKAMMRDSIEFWTEYLCEHGSYEHYTSVCNRAIGLFKPHLKMLGTVSIKGNTVL